MVILNRHLSRDRSQSTDAQQVVGGSDQVRVQLHTGEAAEAGAAQAAVRLHPTEDLFDALALLLADPVARVPRGPSVKTGSVPSIDLREVRTDGLAAQKVDERRAVVTLISPQAAGLEALAQLALHERDRRGRLGLERRTDSTVHAQPIAVLHERMAAEAQLRLFPFTLAGRLGLRIRRRAVRVVGARAATKVDPTATIARWRRSVLGLEALRSGPGLDQRPVHGQMIRGQQILFPRHLDDRIEEPLRQVFLHQPLAQPREVRLVKEDLA